MVRDSIDLSRARRAVRFATLAEENERSLLALAVLRLAATPQPALSTVRYSRAPHRCSLGRRARRTTETRDDGPLGSAPSKRAANDLHFSARWTLWFQK